MQRTNNHEHIQPYPHFVHFKLMVETREVQLQQVGQQ